MASGRVYVAGTCDTKGEELATCAADRGRGRAGRAASISGTQATARAATCRRARSRRTIRTGAAAVFTATAAARSAAMAVAFERFVRTRDDVGGADRARRLRRHRDGHAGDARAADRRAEGDGLDRRLGRRRALCRRVRHRHDVLGHRHRRAQPHLAAWCSATPRTRWPAWSRHAVPRRQAETKPALGLTMFGVTTPCVTRRWRGARRRLRLPRLPRHRHRRRSRWRSSSTAGCSPA